MSKLPVQLGKRIYRFRKERRLTQAALAEKVGISNEFMSAIERGARLPSISTLEDIATALRVRMKDLFNFDEAGFRKMEPLSREALDIGTMVEKLSHQQRRRISRIVRILVEPRGD